VYDHALAIDVADLQVRRFCASCAGGAKCHQQKAVEGIVGGLNQTRCLFRTERPRQAGNLFRIRCFGNAPVSFQHMDVEEAQGSQPLDYRVRAELWLGEEHRLIVTDVLRAKLVG